MHRFRAALAILPILLGGCEDSDTPTASTETASRESGAIAFQLPLQDRDRTQGSWDSLRIELRQGDIKRSVSVPATRPVCLDGMEPGSWSVHLGLYKADGQLTWLGTDSMKVFPGEIVPLSVLLRSVRGTVDSVLRPERASVAKERILADRWFLHQLGQSAVVGATVELDMTDSGTFQGVFPCGSSAGTFAADSNALTLRGLASPVAACAGDQDSALGRRLLAALATTRRWSISAGHLSLRDSAGGLLARFETYPQRDRTRAAVDTLRPLPSVDSTALHIGLARIQSVPMVTDSVILVDLQLPRKGSEVVLVSLPAGDLAPACGYARQPVPDLQRILILETSDPTRFYADALDQIQIAIRWRGLPRRVRLEDRSGRAIEIERP
ncbi:MAG TPA: META domain-containing protein [Fibrobacteria bacterium]|nr:META domain-containing protein [Fibrobacteria bacterium]